MALESGTYISDLVVTNPVNTDTVDKADDHLRLIKSTVKATFPSVAGAVTATHTELNIVDGLTVTTADLNKLSSTGNPQFATIELGAATDTTLSRVSAGLIAVEGKNVALESNSVSFANVTATSNSIVGSGDTSGTPVGGTLRAPAAAGTNIAGANLTIDAGNGTGTGGSGYIAIRTAAAGSTGSTANTLTERMRIDASGNIGIGGAPNYAFDIIKSGAIQARFGSTSGAGTGGAAILSTSASQGIFGGGWDYNGTNFVARSTTASMLLCGSGSVLLNSDAGLTSGNTFTPTVRMQLDTSGNFLQVSSGGIGYGTGSGGTVTQITSRTTSVTLNKTNGAVTLFTAAGVTGSWTTFQVFNSTVATTDTVVVSVKAGATNTYIAAVPAVSAGNFSITFISLAGTASDTPTINFSVIKAVTS